MTVEIHAYMFKLIYTVPSVHDMYVESMHSKILI